MVYNILEPYFLEFSDFLHDTISVENSETVDDPNAFNDVKMRLPPMAYGQQLWEWNERNQVKNKVRVEVPLCNLLQVLCWTSLAILCKLSQKFEAHGENKNGFKS